MENTFEPYQSFSEDDALIANNFRWNQDREMGPVPLCFSSIRAFWYTSRPTYVYLSVLDLVYVPWAKIRIDLATSKWVHFEPCRREEHDGAKINSITIL